MSIKQFDKLFEQLLARHDENKIHWKSLEADLLKSVAKLENHREQGTLFDQLEVQLVSCSKYKLHDQIVLFQPLFLKLILNISFEYFRPNRALFKN